MRESFIRFPNTEKRFDNTTHDGVLLANFEVFGNLMKLSRMFDYGENGDIKS